MQFLISYLMWCQPTLLQIYFYFAVSSPLFLIPRPETTNSNIIIVIYHYAEKLEII